MQLHARFVGHCDSRICVAEALVGKLLQQDFIQRTTNPFPVVMTIDVRGDLNRPPVGMPLAML
jgi:hypothetical protein